MGSASEAEYQLILARDLGYLSSEEFDGLETKLVSVRRMLNSFIQTLRRKK